MSYKLEKTKEGKVLVNVEANTEQEAHALLIPMLGILESKKAEEEGELEGTGEEAEPIGETPEELAPVSPIPSTASITKLKNPKMRQVMDFFVKNGGSQSSSDCKISEQVGFPEARVAAYRELGTFLMTQDGLPERDQIIQYFVSAGMYEHLRTTGILTKKEFQAGMQYATDPSRIQDEHAKEIGFKKGGSFSAHLANQKTKLQGLL